MNIQYLKKIIPIREFSFFEEILASKLISEKQASQILKFSFGFDIDKGVAHNQTSFFKALTIFRFLKVIRLQASSDKDIHNTITRLRDKNLGEESANEIFAHIILHNSFPNYHVANLFGNGISDGYIIDKKLNIPIEIKSRFPDIFNTLNEFYEDIFNLFEMPKQSSLLIIINIDEIKSGVKKVDFENEINHLKKIKKMLHFESFPKFPQGHVFKRKIDKIEYSLSLFKKEKATDFALKSSIDANSLYYSLKTSDLIRSSEIVVYCSDSVKSYFSRSLIKDCLERIKNKPLEPRIFAIYSDHFRQSALTNFFKKTIQNYVDKHRGTAVIATCGYFNERNENTLGVREIIAGQEIISILREQIIKPNLLNT